MIDSDDVDNPGLNQQLATAKGKVDALTVERDTAQDALFAAGVDKAILEATAAMQTYARLLVTYEGIDADADTARGLVTAANRAKTEADEALDRGTSGRRYRSDGTCGTCGQAGRCSGIDGKRSTGGSQDDGGRHALRNGDNDAGHHTS